VFRGARLIEWLQAVSKKVATLEKLRTTITPGLAEYLPHLGIDFGLGCGVRRERVDNETEGAQCDALLLALIDGMPQNCQSTGERKTLGITCVDREQQNPAKFAIIRFRLRS